MIGAIASDIIGSRFEGHPGPLLFHPRCRFTDDSLLAPHSGRAPRQLGLCRLPSHACAPASRARLWLTAGARLPTHNLRHDVDSFRQQRNGCRNSRLHAIAARDMQRHREMDRKIWVVIWAQGQMGNLPDG